MLPHTSEPHDPAIPIIILNWNGLEDTLECIETVLTMDKTVSYHIILVDNGSDQKNKSTLKERYGFHPQISLVFNEQNLGFTKGNNNIVNKIISGINPPQFVALLNNDTIVDRNWLKELSRTAIEFDADMVSSKMINYYYRNKIDNVGHVLLNTGEILPKGHDEHFSQYNEVDENVGACGGAALYKVSLIQEIGFFDEYFNTGYEDAEFGLRAKLLGYKCLFSPTAIVFHKGSRSISKIRNDKYLRRIQINIFYTYFKLMPIRFLIVNVPIAILRYLFLLILGLLFLRFKLLHIYGGAVLRFFRNDIYHTFKARKQFRRTNRISKHYRRSSINPSTSFLRTDLKRLGRLIFHQNTEEDGRKHVVVIGLPLDNQFAGVHVYTKNFVKALNNANNTKFRYSVIRLKDNSFWEYPNLNTIVIQTNRWFPGYETIRLFIVIPWMLRKHKADIVLEPAHFGPWNLPSRMKRVTMIHDITPILFPELHTFRGSFFHRIFLRRILGKADIILTNSANTSKDVALYEPSVKSKLRRIYLGVGDEYYVARNRSAIEELGIKNRYFLVIGTIEPRKNHVLILEAFENFKKRSSSATKLVIVGKMGWKYLKFKKLLSVSPCRKDVILTDYVDDMTLRSLYGDCIAMIYASSYEGFGLPVVEAGACGALSIIAQNSSLKELAHDGIWYFDDKSELVDKMTGAVNFDIESEEKNRWSLYIRKRYSWNEYVKNFENTLADAFLGL